MWTVDEVGNRIRVSLLVAVSTFSLLVPGCFAGETGSPPVTASRTAAGALAGLPLAFEPNVGQASGDVQYLARMPGSIVLLGTSQLTMALHRRVQPVAKNDATVPSEVTELLRVDLLGTASSSRARGERRLAATSNYFIGSDAAQWRRKVATYSRVRYSSIYRNVDLLYYGKNGSLEYDFVVRPGGNPESIRFALPDTMSVELEPSGDLIVQASDSQMRMRRPVSYQVIDGRRREVQSRFRQLGDREYGLELGHYDRRRAVVIDPVLAYSSYLGGIADEGIFGITFDSSGNIYLAGETSSVNFPVANSLQSHLAGNYDAFVAKFDPTGRTLLYSTYLGGSDYDHATSLLVDDGGNVYMGGVTRSMNFPTANALQSSYSGNGDGFVAKISPTGSELIFSTYLGGTSFDLVSGIAVGRGHSIYLTGSTSSTNFPTTAHAISNRCDLGVNTICTGDAFITKLDSTGHLMYSTYLGGSSPDGASGITADTFGDAYVTGQTGSHDFPVLMAWQRALAGSVNAFVLKLHDGGGPIWSTYLGGSGVDSGTGITVDRQRNVYVTGTTTSPNFPLSHAFQTSNHGGQSDGFVTKFDERGTHLVYSTYIGGSGWDFPWTIKLFNGSDATIVGFTSSADFPLSSPLQSIYGGGRTDAFVAQFDYAGNQLRFSTYLGGSGDDAGYAIAIGSSHTMWVGGSTSSVNFPLVNAFQPVYGGGPFDAFFSKIGNLSGSRAGLAESAEDGQPERH
jgi:hypothetical protein